jgi:S1-C subfamily serine protease
VILSNGAKEAGQVAGTDPANDLAVVKIAVPPGGFSVATLGVSSQLQVGQQVLAIGNPLGDTETVTSVIVSALKRSVAEGQGPDWLPLPLGIGVGVGRTANRGHWNQPSTSSRQRKRAADVMSAADV